MKGARGKEFMCERLGSGKDDIQLLLVSGFTWVMFVSEGILIQQKKKFSQAGIPCGPVLRSSLSKRLTNNN
jgi:hypothetical protein